MPPVTSIASLLDAKRRPAEAVLEHIAPGAELLIGAVNAEPRKNIVDGVVTEHGVAELRGSTIRERATRLIAVAHPKFRDDLARRAREMHYL